MGMGKISIILILLLLFILTGCSFIKETQNLNTQTEQEQKPATSDRPVDHQSQEMFEILEEKAPELIELANQIEEKSNGQAHLVMYIERELNYISEDEYERDYYRIYVGESHPTHQVNLHRFLIYKNLHLKKVLHVDPVTLEPETLEEWRTKK